MGRDGLVGRPVTKDRALQFLKEVEFGWRPPPRVEAL